MKRPQYANTLEMIAWNGAGWFYNSEFMKAMVRELREYGSILTEEDFKGYSAIKRRVTQSYFAGLKLNSVSAPSSGAVLGLILNILDSKRRVLITTHKSLTLHSQNITLRSMSLMV